MYPMPGISLRDPRAQQNDLDRQMGDQGDG